MGDINYAVCDQIPLGIASDHQGYTYALIADNRLDTIDYQFILFLSSEKFSVTDVYNEDLFVNEFYVYQNYPNPFNSSTIISFYIPARSRINFKIYDILGREIAELLNEEINEGKHQIKFNAGQYNLVSGVYFYTLESGYSREHKKLLLLK